MKLKGKAAELKKFMLQEKLHSISSQLIDIAEEFESVIFIDDKILTDEKEIRKEVDKYFKDKEGDLYGRKRFSK